MFKAFVQIWLNVNLSLNQTPDIETHLDNSIDSSKFSVKGYFPLSRKDSTFHMHGIVVYVKEALLFARDLSPENCADSYLCFRLTLLHSVSSGELCYIFLL